MRKNILLVLLSFVATVAMAVPAKKSLRTVTMADGSTQTIQLVGDEKFHYHCTLDGKAVEMSSDGKWRYASTDVNAAKARAQKKFQVVDQSRQKKLAVMNSRNAMRRARKAGQADHKKGVVILVQFTDVKFSSPTATADYQQLFNSVNNPFKQNAGSVHEYFLDQSYGKLDLNFDVIGPITLSHDLAYYGTNDADGNDEHVTDMVREACQLIDDQVNFKDYDWFGDGQVDQVYLIYAGYGENVDGNDATCIWPHQWFLDGEKDGTIVLDDETINSYACSNELSNTPTYTKNNGYKLEGIGTPCHEFSHCLGLPDMYDTDYKGHFGMNLWSLMDYGSYREDGYVPAPYTAYERISAGWMDPIVLDKSCEISNMPAITDEPTAYVIYNDANKNEYYVLSNHQKENKWEKGNPTHGMMISHIYYSQSLWEKNKVNNYDVQHITLFPADNKLDENTLSGDLWNGVNGNGANMFNDVSSPAQKLYTKNEKGGYLMGKPVENISENNGMISFSFMGGVQIDAPTNLYGQLGTVDTTVALNWQASKDASSYEVTYSKKGTETADMPVSMLSEDFSEFPSKNDQQLAGTNSGLDTYTSVEGWLGTKVFSAGSGWVKLGSGSKPGQLITPDVDTNTGNVTVVISAAQYNSRENTLNVTLTDVMRDQTQTIESLPEKSAPGLYILNFKNVSESYYITFESKNRAYIHQVYCFDNAITKEEFEKGMFSKDGNSTAVGQTAQFKDQITDLNTVISGLERGYIYTFMVRAIDSEGHKSGWSNAVTIEIPAVNTAISTIQLDTQKSEAIYDLTGRKVNNKQSLKSGLYIIDGKKVIIK